MSDRPDPASDRGDPTSDRHDATLHRHDPTLHRPDPTSHRPRSKPRLAQSLLLSLSPSLWLSLSPLLLLLPSLPLPLSLLPLLPLLPLAQSVPPSHACIVHPDERLKPPELLHVHFPVCTSHCKRARWLAAQPPSGMAQLTPRLHETPGHVAVAFMQKLLHSALVETFGMGVTLATLPLPHCAEHSSWPLGQVPLRHSWRSMLMPFLHVH